MPTKPQTLETETSRRLFARAVALIPGGVNSPVRAWRSVGGEPLFLQRGVGARIWDADENEFLDYVGSWGPLILGHAHPTVIATIQNTAVNGTSFGTPTELEIKLAERIVGAVPSIERVRFVNSGTEATMSALRLARAFTGRTKLIKFDGGYHGHADFLLAKAGSGIATLGLPDSAGVPTLAAADTLVAPYNDAAAVEKLFEQNRGEIAAVIVEPIVGNMGVVAPQAGYLTQLREITTAHGALLIFDEVISGFRAAWGGAQSLYGVTPDLTCLGKIIGGGLPVGAYGGRRDIMELVAPLGPMYQAGTLSGNPLAMAAGLATLDTLRQTPSAYAQLEALGAELEEGLRAVAHEANVPLTINRAGSLLTAFFTNVPVTDYASAKTSDTKRFAQWFQGMLQDHIYLAPSQFEAAFISLAHTPHDIARTVESAARVLTEIGRTGARQV